MLIELIYTSAAHELLHAQKLADILASARRNNAGLGVSGILLYDAGSFLQVLEGEESSVIPLFERIGRDSRHYRVRVLRRAPIERRSFAEWTMGFVTFDPQLVRSLPRRHALSSNGSLLDDDAAVVETLDAFRNGSLRGYILG